MAVREPLEKAEESNLRHPKRAEYLAIVAAYEDNDLEGTLDLMNGVAVYALRVPRFRQQLTQLMDEEIEGQPPTVNRREIAAAIFDFIEAYQPMEEAVSEADWPTGIQGTAFVVTAANKALLPIPKAFIGREEISDRLLTLLEEEGTEGICLHGLGGNGKTSLSHFTLRRWLERSDERRVYWVGLEFISSAAALRHALAAFIAPGAPAQNDEEIFRQLDKLPAGILYLDNLESVLDDPEAYSLVERLALRANSLSVLASSRRQLAGFHGIALDVLSKNDGVALFSHLWWRHRGEQLNQEEQEKLQQFVREELGSHPLSIELVASHAETVIDLNQLMEEFQEAHPHYLTRFASSGGGRLNNLHGSFELSLRKLADQPKAMAFLFLNAVLQEGINGKLQKILIQSNLFTPTDRATLFKRNLLKVVKGKLLSPPPLSRFLRSYLALEEESERREQIYSLGLVLIFGGHTSTPASLSFIDFYTPFLVQFPDLVVAYASLSFSDLSRYFYRAQPVLEKLSAHPLISREESGFTRASIQQNLGLLTKLRGETATAAEYLFQSLETWQVLGDQARVARVNTELGKLFHETGDYSKALTYFTEAKHRFLQLEDRFNAADAFFHIGRVELQLREFEKAHLAFEQALKAYDTIDEPMGEARVLAFLSRLERLRDNEPAAQQHYQKAIRLIESVHPTEKVGIAAAQLGGIIAMENDFATAANFLSFAEEKHQREASLHDQAMIQRGLATFHARQGNSKAAATHWMRSIELFQQKNAHPNVATGLLELANYLKTVHPENEHIPIVLQQAQDLIEKYNLDGVRSFLRYVKENN